MSAVATGGVPAARRNGRGARLLRVLALRALQAVAVAFGVVTVTFLLIHLVPGDPAQQVLGLKASPEAVQALRLQLHLDDPLLTQYGKFLAGVVHGDLGQSIAQSRPVAGIIGSGLGVTLVLVGGSMALSSVIGIALGLWAGTTRSRLVDRALRFGSMIGLGTPPFFLGALLLLVVSVRLGLAPAGGWADAYPERLRFLWLPTLTLCGLLSPIFARAVRQRARVVMREQFVEAAVARGLPRRRLILSHVLPNSALPAITLIGLNAGALLASAVVVETLFGLPGLGSVLLTAVQGRDYPVVQGIAVVAGLFVVLCNLLADAAIRIVDPRTRT